jgi:hypothetical protein
MQEQLPTSEIQETTTYKSLGKMFQNLLIKIQQQTDNLRD